MPAASFRDSEIILFPERSSDSQSVEADDFVEWSPSHRFGRGPE
jgi:hypothetical protein